MSLNVFRAYRSTPVASSTTSTNVQLLSRTTQVRIMNTSSSVAWVAFGDDNTVAAAVPSDKTATGSIPVAPGATEVFTRHDPVTYSYAAVVLESGTGKVIFTEGEGF